MELLNRKGIVVSSDSSEGKQPSNAESLEGVSCSRLVGACFEGAFLTQQVYEQGRSQKSNPQIPGAGKE